jgi:hypothetical protein
MLRLVLIGLLAGLFVRSSASAAASWSPPFCSIPFHERPAM